MDEHRRQQLERATQSLQVWLEPLTFADLSRSATTEVLKAQVVAWARSHRFQTQTEVEAVAAARRRHKRSIGLLDVLATHPSGQQVAIEIDFTNKVWSIEKLAAEADAGKLAIWVKWGTPPSLALIPEKIGVVRVAVRWTDRAGHIAYSRCARTDTTAICESPLAS